MRILLLLLLLACLPLLATDPVFDAPALIGTPLNTKVLKSTEKDGIITEEVTFHSEMDGEKSVEIFAFFCYPKGAKGLPAFVWNQAGLGKASTYFPELGAKRGYAALCIDYPLPNYRSTGSYNVYVGLDGDPKASGLYHTAVALLKAVSYLQSRPEVDPERIGMAGSSWGGFFTTMMAGIDPRLKAASAMFGCGALELGNQWWDGAGNSAKMTPADRERWKATLDPALRLPNSKTAMGWFSGTNDVFYWMPALMESHARAGGPKHLSLMPNWDHGLPPQLDDQVFGWLDVHLQGKPPFVTVTPLSIVEKGTRLYARWSFTPVPGRPIKSAELTYSFGEAGNWSSRYWQPLPVRINGTQCETELPVTRMPYYIAGTVCDEQGYRYSTPLVRVSPDELLRPRTALEIIDYNGAIWGDFEDASLVIARAFAMRLPPLVKDAHDGVQAAKLPAGRTVLPPIYFTAGTPHRLTCWLKSDTPLTVTLKLTGRFDGEVLSQEKSVEVNTHWTPVTMDFTPAQALSGNLSVEISVPKDAEVLLDSLSFRPSLAL
ncbi:MAG: alpha/beta hydrolase family protein [Armatimonadota bacterium]